MDGKFDDDKSYIFQTQQNTAINVPRSTTTRYPALSLRVAPSVDNGVVGTLGQRELINRMQLALYQMDVLASITSSAGSPGLFMIEVVLNGKLSTATGNTWQNVGGSSLSQVMYHAANTTISGGESIFSYFLNVLANDSNVGSNTLTQVKTLGNAIYAGGTTTTGSTDGSNIYPDGPDVVTICIRNLSGTGVTANTINARLSWQEAQA